MKHVDNRTIRFLTIFTLTLFLLSGYALSHAADAGTSKVVFYVK